MSEFYKTRLSKNLEENSMGIFKLLITASKSDIFSLLLIKPKIY